MEEPSDPVAESLVEMREQFQRLLAKQVVSDEELADIKRKDSEQSFARTWLETVTSETQDPIGRVVALLEAPK